MSTECVPFVSLPEWAQQIVVDLPGDTVMAIAEALAVDPFAFTVDGPELFFGSILLGRRGAT